jgi:hypothetical protein
MASPAGIKKLSLKPILVLRIVFLFLRAMRKIAMFAWIFDECRGVFDSLTDWKTRYLHRSGKGS